MTDSFHKTKAALVQATMLTHPKPRAPIGLTTDAYDVGIGLCYSSGTISNDSLQSSLVGNCRNQN